MNRDELILSVFHRTGSARAVARETGIPRSTVRDSLRRLGARESGKVAPEPVKEIRHKAYILTSAQNNTYIHTEFWRNLCAYSAHTDARLMVATYNYDLNSYGSKSVKRGTTHDKESLWYDERIMPYIADDNIEIADSLVWCGRANISPTAERPLSGFETYTGKKSGIFPHAKVSLQSIPNGKHEHTKFNYTTGTATLINYIQKKAGLKAEHHHTYGALYVEVSSDGTWFCRQLIAGSDGTFFDLDVLVKDGVVVRDQPVEAITWGDVHVAQLDKTVSRLAWGAGGMLDTLRPKHQFFHDVLDFHSRNHHDRSNHHAMFARHVVGVQNVQREVADVCNFLRETSRPWCRSVVVDSNHDNALMRWLREADYRTDHENAVYFLTLQLAVYQSILNRSELHLLEYACNLECDVPAVFLRQDESYVICDGIECGMHGDLGPNGARGTARNLSRMGRKANTGHSHSAEIINGMYVAGVSGKLDMGYNKGPSSWSHSHIVTYTNGKRAIVTMFNGKWRA